MDAPTGSVLAARSRAHCTQRNAQHCTAHTYHHTHTTHLCDCFVCTQRRPRPLGSLVQPPTSRGTLKPPILTVLNGSPATAGHQKRSRAHGFINRPDSCVCSLQRLPLLQYGGPASTADIAQSRSGGYPLRTGARVRAAALRENDVWKDTFFLTPQC